MRSHKFIFAAAPSALAAFLAVTASNTLWASKDDEEHEGVSAFKTMSLEDLEKKLREEEELNEQIQAQKAGEEEKRKALIERIAKAQSDRAGILGAAQTLAPSTIASDTSSNEENEEDRLKVIESAKSGYKLLVSQKLGDAIKASYPVAPRDHKNLQDISSAKVSSLIQTQLAGNVAWERDGGSWLDLLRPHFQGNLSLRDASGTYKGGRISSSTKIKGRYDWPQLLDDCWFSGGGIKNFAGGRANNPEALNIPTEETFVASQVEEWRKSSH